ncbi:DUF5366 family protein [Fictibacillus barbaricus]|uniref:DUF5366 family protein n=1 Tax=Fictibacillus barbaricus TaxID=182136 RepID=A0ABS2ZCH7_9BACL|nr:DUF5366 family protein [Fictibacillus barbaricus]MBN3544445.1 DUF5366 family protein [Fictibacillus barbaricus]GGB66643.1 hypothetical protein GCM10007199_36180 [Fictibacillus barbaricus]
MKKNVYMTGYLPLFSIILFSSGFAIYFERLLIDKLRYFGVYQGMRELFPDHVIHLSVGFCLFLLFFMGFAALKLLSDTLTHLSLFFFSRDSEGTLIQQGKNGGWFFFAGGMLSIILNHSILLLCMVFGVASLVYFFYFLLKIGSSLSTAGIMGMVFMHLFFWTGFSLLVVYTVMRLYNAFVAAIT